MCVCVCVSYPFLSMQQNRINCSRLSLPFFNLLIYELGQTHGDLEGACCAFRAIFLSGLRPNTISYNSLLSALVKDINGTVPVILPGKASTGGPLSLRGRGERDEEEEDDEEEEQVGRGRGVDQDDEEGGGDSRTLPYFREGDGIAFSEDAQATMEMLDALTGRSNLESALAGKRK